MATKGQATSLLHLKIVGPCLTPNVVFLDKTLNILL